MNKCLSAARFFSGVLITFLLFSFTAAFAGTPVVHIGPRPSWLSVCKPYDKRPSLRTVEGGYYFQLVEHQVQVEKQADYHHLIREIVSDAGIQNGSEISVSFDPAFETLQFHDITVWREGKPQNRLKSSAFKVIADEKDLSDFIYQGSYSALCILDDIRRGDRIEYSYTITGRNPIFQGKFCEFLYFQFDQTVQHQYTSLVFSSQRKLNMKAFSQLSSLKISEANGLKRYEWEDFEVKPAAEAANAPNWFENRANEQVSEYASWAEVAAWALSINPYQANPRGELGDMVKKLKQQSGGDKAKYFRSAVTFVQDEVRYMGIEIGQYSHRANKPERVFSQRYGDCKDKSLLLVSMLQADGIDAHMVLINTELEGHVKDYLPGADLFNHAVLSANVNGRQVWVDATIDDQGGEGTTIYFPNYGVGLVLQPGATALTDVPQQEEPGQIKSEELYKVKNVTSPVDFKVTTTYTNNEADRIRDWLASTGMNEVEKKYLDYYSGFSGKVEQIDSITVNDDRAKNILTTIEHYKLTDYFKRDSTTDRYGADFYADCIKRELPEINAQTKTPVSVAYPYNRVHIERMILPYNWDIEPDHSEINRNAYKFSSDVGVTGDTLSLIYHFNYLKSFVPANDLQQFRDDIKQLANKKLAYSVSVPADAGDVADTGKSAPINQWMFNLALLMVLVFGVAGLFIYRMETPGIVFSYGANFMHLGGWLVLVGLGLFLTPFFALRNLADGNYFDLATWNNISHGANASARQAALVFGMCGHLLIFCLAIFCLILYFNKRDILPKFIIGYYATGLVVNIINLFLQSNARGNAQAAYSQAVIMSLIAAGIWIPYFIFSQRVKATFIVPHPAHNYSYEKAPVPEDQENKRSQ